MQNAKIQIDELAKRIIDSSRIVVFTGAGVSTESGIPDFRSPGGIWDQYDPEIVSFQKFSSSEENRKEYWQFNGALFKILRSAKPNATHYAIAELERLGKLDCVITQNIDNLHQRAGNTPEKVIELHGNAFKVRCMSCEKKWDRAEIQERLDKGEAVPHCNECGGLLKPTTILFGESMPERETREAFERARNCELFIVLGSSLVVYPAAAIPMEAVNAHAKLAIINLTPTPYDSYADIVLYDKCSIIMEKVIAQIRMK